MKLEEVQHEAFLHSLKRTLFLILNLFVCRIIGFAQVQNVKFDHIKFDSRQPLGNIAVIRQDEQGFLWIATTEGLLRYDGYSFKTYRHDRADSNSLAGNWLNACEMDSKGNLWLATGFNGLDYFEVSTERVTHYYDPRHPERIPSPITNSVFVDKRGLVWIATNRGLSLFDPGAGTYTLFQHDPGNPASLGADNIASVCEDSRGNIWISFLGDGIDLFHRDSRTFTHFRKDPANPRTLSNESVNLVFEDHAGVLWVATEGGLNTLDPTTGACTRYLHDPDNANTISSNTVGGIIEDGEGNLWIGTAGGGVNVLNRDRNRWTRLQHDPADPSSLSDNNVAAKCIDRTGNIWFGSRNGHVDKWCPTKLKFSLYRYNDLPSQKFPFNIVWAFMEDTSHRLWVGTQNGVLVFDSAMNLRQRFTHDDGVPGSLLFPTVRAIMQDRRKRIWIGTAQGPELFDERGKRFIPLLKGVKSDYETADGVNTLYLDSSGTMWTGTRSGDILAMSEHSVDRWLALGKPPYGPEYARYSLISSGHDSLTNHAVARMSDDSTRLVWLGRVGGLCRLHPSSGRYENIFLEVIRNLGQTDNRFLAAVPDPDAKSTFWIGTMSGLVECDTGTGRVRLFTEREGLANNLVYGILPDHHGNLWMSTNNGISKFNLQSETFRNYGPEEGIQGSEYNRGAYLQLSTGMMLFGGMQGFNYFNPGDIRDNVSQPPIVLTSFQVDDRPYPLPWTISFMKEITLPWEDDHFSFEFAALDYTNPDLNRYSYKLEGYDKNWIASGSRRFESYTNLEPGDYTFRVKGSNNENYWNEEGTSINIVVLPPYWRTWWFRTMAAAAISGILYGLYRFRIQKILELERLRFRISSDLHDDIGSGLSGIALLSDTVRERVAPDDQAHGQLHEISRTARQLTESMRDIVWFVNPDRDRLEDMIDRMRQVAGSMLAGKQHSFEMSVGSESHKISMEAKRHVFLMYKEILHNIVKHSGATSVGIGFQQEDSTATLTVRDNGKGFDPSVPGQGNGLRNLEARAKALKAELTVESAPGSGTSIRLKFNI